MTLPPHAYLAIIRAAGNIQIAEAAFNAAMAAVGLDPRQRYRFNDADLTIEPIEPVAAGEAIDAFKAAKKTRR